MKRLQAIALAAFLVSLFTVTYAQNMKSNAAPEIKIRHQGQDFEISDFANDAWKNGTEVLIHNYWSGEKAHEARWVKANLLWSDTGFYVRFEANQAEPLVVATDPDLTKKTVGLWDRDVCEIFIAPDKRIRSRYFEFEVAPTGEWIDLAINTLPKR
ncbi:MAG TPA: sugar-binding protein, partial [Pyrinomonadaceae bacterium]|nr:sugar-binding protein [Pyrinomonadaceae bacterium]